MILECEDNLRIRNVLKSEELSFPWKGSPLTSGLVGSFLIEATTLEHQMGLWQQVDFIKLHEM